MDTNQVPWRLDHSVTIGRDKVYTHKDLQRFACGLERVGWAIRNFELDIQAGRAKIDLARLDVGDAKRVVTFFARDGRAIVERSVESRHTVLIGRRGDQFRAERIRTEFLGRQRFEGIRTGLRYLCSYLADNSALQLNPADVRALLAPLMQ